MTVYLAQTPGHIIDPWINLGAVGVMGFCFVLVLKWMLKQQTAAGRENTLAIHTNSLILLQLQKDLLRHDATVRGLNPSAGEDSDKRSRKAIELYSGMLNELDAISQTVKARMEKIPVE